MMRIRSNDGTMVSFGVLIMGALALLLGTVAPAAAQNSTGTLTPFATGQNPTGLLTPFSTNTPPPMLRPGGGDHGDGGHHHGHHEFPVFVTPFFSGFIDDQNTQVQISPVNPQPFKPAESPAPGGRPIAPYKPPSVEIAPGGIEIVRGPSNGPSP